jgi:hypothetical protein
MGAAFNSPHFSLYIQGHPVTFITATKIGRAYSLVLIYHDYIMLPMESSTAKDARRRLSSSSFSSTEHTLLYAGLGTGIGAIVDTMWQLLCSFATNVRPRLDFRRIVGFATAMGLVSALIGHRESTKQERFPDRADMIEHQNNSLPAELAADSFVTRTSRASTVRQQERNL